MPVSREFLTVQQHWMFTTLRAILNMIEKFEEEDDDDVSNVFHNLEITDALIAEME